MYRHQATLAQRIAYRLNALATVQARMRNGTSIPAVMKAWRAKQAHHLHCLRQYGVLTTEKEE